MAAVVDMRTATRVGGSHRPELVLIESPVDLGRVYLRRRVFVAVVVALALVAAFLIGSRILEASQGAPVSVGSHVVMPDETLWSIAKDVRPNHDPRSTIMLVTELNSTEASTFDPWAPLAVGQRIRVPVDG